MRRTFTICFLLSIFALTSIAQSYKSDHSFRFDDELNSTGASADERSVNGMIPLYDSITYYAYYVEDSSFHLNLMDKNFVYDAHCNIISFDQYINWFYYKEIKFTYNSTNQLTRKTEIWGNSYDTISDLIYEYDANGNCTLFITKSESYGSFCLNYRESKTFDNNNNILTRLIERLNMLDSLINYTKEDYLYENNNLSIKYLVKWINNAWVNEFKSIYSYGTNGKVSEILYMMEDSGSWTESSKYIYSYHDDGNLASQTVKSYNQGSWVNVIKANYMYISNKILTEAWENWVDGQWVNFFNIYNYYDAELNMVDHQCHQLIDGEFILYDFTRQTFDSDNIMTSKVAFKNTYNLPPTIASGDSTIYNFRKVVGVEETEKSVDMTIYPNPTSGIVIIDVSFPIIRTELYNLAGEHVVTFITKSNIIDLSSQPKGVYLLKVITQKEAYVRKVMVQ